MHLIQRFAMIEPNIPHSLRELVNSELECDERIAWIGMPKRVFFNSSTTILFLLGIPWTALAFSWTAIGILGSTNLESSLVLFSLVSLFGFPFVLIGILMLSSPIWNYLCNSKSVYVITDRRVLTIFGGWKTTIRSYTPDKLTDVFRKEKRDGSGDVIFVRRTWRESDGDRQSEELGIFGVDDARDVERRLKGLIEESVAKKNQGYLD